MKPPLIIGAALAVVIIAAAFVSPVLRSSSSKTAEKAQDQASLAERQLARYSVTLPRLDGLANTADMKKNEADLQVAVAAATADPNGILPRAGREYGELVRKAQKEAQHSGLPAPKLSPLGTDAAGVQRALAEFQASLQANNALLKAALKDAQGAVGLDPTAIGVSQALGMAQYVQAAGLLAEAEELRLQQADTQGRLLDAVSQWKVAQGYLDHYRGLDVAPTVAGLRTDLDDITKLHTDATAAVTTLTAQVAERERALTQAEQSLAAANQQLQALESRGFTAGDDASFAAYRQEYERLSQQVRELQQQVQELRNGTRLGAEPTDEELAGAAEPSGEVVIGLTELQRRLADAQERAKRLEGATRELNEHLTYVSGLGKGAESEVGRYQTRLTELEAAQKMLVTELVTLATNAAAKEGEALQAAEAAARAFKQAQGGVDAWLRVARELQRDRDPNRKNDRLRLILQDQYLEQVPRSAEAAARVLAARIYAQICDCTEALLRDAQVLAATNPQFDLHEIDTAKLQAEVDKAQTDGQATLGQAVTLYTTVSEKWANQPTKWVPLAGLAGAQNLLARLDPTQAAVHLAKAAELIQQAVEKREQSPYVKSYVAFRDYLKAGERPSGEPKPAPKKEEEKAGFFSDEDKQ